MKARMTEYKYGWCEHCDEWTVESNWTPTDLHVHTESPVIYDDSEYAFENGCTYSTYYYCEDCSEYQSTTPQFVKLWKCSECLSKFEDRTEANECC